MHFLVSLIEGSMDISIKIGTIPFNDSCPFARLILYPTTVDISYHPITDDIGMFQNIEFLI